MRLVTQLLHCRFELNFQNLSSWGAGRIDFFYDHTIFTAHAEIRIHPY